MPFIRNLTDQNYIFIAGYYDDTTTNCDDLIARLDYLNNISPLNYNGDDPEFSRYNKSTVGEGQAAYGEKSYNWISNKV